MPTLTLPATQPTTDHGTATLACGCDPAEPFCSCPSAASAMFDDRYDHSYDNSYDDSAADALPFDPFHNPAGLPRAGVLA